MKKTFLIIILNLVFTGFAFSQNHSEYLELANKNIEKYRKSDFSITLENFKKVKNETIEITVEQTSHDFLFGCIIFDLVNHGRKPENETLFKKHFKQLFNFAVFPFYWAGYEPVQGSTKQAEIMEVVKWCKENGINTKGHPLVWTHEAGTPKWLKNYSSTKSKELLQKRVEKIVSDFKGEIDIWDVINEVIHTVNWEVAMAENKAGKDNRYTGENLMMDKVDFIDSCFRWANIANPGAHLIINEFNVVASEEARQDFYSVVKKLLQKNSPVKGIGIQVHEPDRGRYYYSPEQIWKTYEKYAEFDLPLHVTEFIPVSNGDSITGIYKTGTWSEQVQADFAEMIFTLSFGHPKLASINWWGFTDKNIWQEGGGLLDENLHPKPVYKKLDELINSKWNTKISGLKADKNGVLSFRGFKGNYKITFYKNGKKAGSEYLHFDGSTNYKVAVNL